MFSKVIVKLLGGYNGLRMKYFKTKSLKSIFKIILKLYQHAHGAYLPFDTNIAGPIQFIHGAYGIFLSRYAEIGKNCIIYHHVTIGSNALYGSNGLGAPKIGDNCLIGAGAKIIGNVKIGNNCRIGANCVVTTDVPDNSIVVLPKPVIIERAEIINKNYSRSNKGWGYSLDGVFVLETDELIIKNLNSHLNK